jgi:hypothetical protein
MQSTAIGPPCVFVVLLDKVVLPAKPFAFLRISVIGPLIHCFSRLSAVSEDIRDILQVSGSSYPTKYAIAPPPYVCDLDLTVDVCTVSLLFSQKQNTTVSEELTPWRSTLYYQRTWKVLLQPQQSLSQSIRSMLPSGHNTQVNYQGVRLYIHGHLLTDAFRSHIRTAWL